MISSSMLCQTCRIHRTVTDETKSYVTTSEVPIGEYPCYISQKQTALQVQSDTQHWVSADLQAFLNLPADIRQGDRLECEGTFYTVGLVYKPANRHIQADIRRQDES